MKFAVPLCMVCLSGLTEVELLHVFEIHILLSLHDPWVKTTLKFHTGYSELLVGDGVFNCIS